MAVVLVNRTVRIETSIIFWISCITLHFNYRYYCVPLLLNICDRAIELIISHQSTEKTVVFRLFYLQPLVHSNVRGIGIVHSQHDVVNLIA